MFQLVVIVEDQRAETVAKCFMENWIRYFGPPLALIADQGKEFPGEKFKDMCNSQSVLLHVINVRAPWENARTERHGDMNKKIYVKTCYLKTPGDKRTERMIVAECNSTKNRLYNRSGYSHL